MSEGSQPSRAKQLPLFVLSSGRTGSTLLARIIHRHPEMLCVSDLFEPVGRVPYFERGGVVSGEEFFRVLSRPSFPQRIEYWRHQRNQELLFLHPEDAMVSLLLSYTLPFLAKEPMELFHELRQACAAKEAEDLPGSLIWLFEWLRDRFGKRVWVERTGGSLPHTGEIVGLWPEGKYVHSFRDCRETALSMMTGSFFRLYLELLKNPDLGRWDWEHMPPVEEMGAMLNRWVVDAGKALEVIPQERRLDLRFEDLVEQPAKTLLELSSFLLDREAPTAVDRAWARREAQGIRRPSLRFAGLSKDERKRLQESVAPALGVLGYPLRS